jgi:hypothetical protein
VKEEQVIHAFEKLKDMLSNVRILMTPKWFGCMWMFPT